MNLKTFSTPWPLPPGGHGGTRDHHDEDQANPNRRRIGFPGTLIAALLVMSASIPVTAADGEVGPSPACLAEAQNLEQRVAAGMSIADLLVAADHLELACLGSVTEAIVAPMGIAVPAVEIPEVPEECKFAAFNAQTAAKILLLETVCQALQEPIVPEIPEECQFALFSAQTAANIGLLETVCQAIKEPIVPAGCLSAATLATLGTSAPASASLLDPVLATALASLGNSALATSSPLDPVCDALDDPLLPDDCPLLDSLAASSRAADPGTTICNLNAEALLKPVFDAIPDDIGLSVPVCEGAGTGNLTATVVIAGTTYPLGEEIATGNLDSASDTITSTGPTMGFKGNNAAATVRFLSEFPAQNPGSKVNCKDVQTKTCLVDSWEWTCKTSHTWVVDNGSGHGSVRQIVVLGLTVLSIDISTTLHGGA